MPDDDNTEVTEQNTDSTEETVDTSITEEVTGDTEEDTDAFDDAFSDALKEDMGEKSTTDTTDEKEEETETDQKTEDVDDKSKTDDEKGDDKADESDQELTDAEKRGAELLDEQEEDAKAVAEEKQALEDQNRQTTENVGLPPVSPKLAKIFSEMVTKDNIPKTLEIGDQELDLHEYMDDHPEILPIAGAMMREGMDRMIQNGVLMRGTDIHQLVEEKLFDLQIGSSHSDAATLIASDEFKSWFNDEASAEEQALFGSSNPADHVMGLDAAKGFLGLDAAKVSKARATKKATAVKKRHIDLHANTVRSKGTGKKIDTSADKDDYDGGFDDALEEVQKENRL